MSTVQPVRRGHVRASLRGITLSKADKPLWPAVADAPAITKQELASYYDAVCQRLLPHVRGRPCSIIRAPDGIHGQRFFQRHVLRGASPAISQVKIRGAAATYLQFDSVQALVAAAQIACVELHPWNCQPGMPEVPGRLVFDLDPAPELEFTKVVAAARELAQRLRAVGLEAFCKTTGGKGLHVVTPLAATRSRDVTWDLAKSFALEICRQMAEDSPSLYLINMSKAKRVGKIFLDYLRNDRMATAVAPWSPRARDGAPLSVPLSWGQVRAGLDPARYTLRSLASLTSRAPAWQDYCDAERPLLAAAKQLLGKRKR